jgi:rod shape-determining protein MreD
MHWVQRGLLLVGALWMQMMVSAALGHGRTPPDLLFVLAVVAGLVRGPLAGAGWGLALGLASDLVAGRLIGLGALSLAAPALVAGLLARRVYRENLLVLGAMAVGLALLSTLVYALGAGAMGLRFDLARSIAVVGTPRAASSAVLVPAAYALAYRRLRMLERSE